MDITQSTILLLALFSMGIVAFLSIIPFVPGPILVWSIGLLTAFLTGFDRVTPLAAGLMTIFMLVGTFQEFWLPFFGIRSEGLSCLGAIGSIIGGLVGTFLIPIPIIGTILGSMAGALLVELARFREMRRAFTAGRVAFTLYLWGVVVEFAFSILIILTFAVSAWSTG